MRHGAGALRMQPWKERPGYRMISSARSSSDWGSERPSACIVFRLITLSIFDDCSIGNSPTFAPLMILSTNDARRRDQDDVGRGANHLLRHLVDPIDVAVRHWRARTRRCGPRRSRARAFRP
jgi:hypothetical protein